MVLQDIKEKNKGFQIPESSCYSFHPFVSSLGYHGSAPLFFFVSYLTRCCFLLTLKSYTDKRRQFVWNLFRVHDDEMSNNFNFNLPQMSLLLYCVADIIWKIKSWLIYVVYFIYFRIILVRVNIILVIQNKLDYVECWCNSKKVVKRWRRNLYNYGNKLQQQLEKTGYAVVVMNQIYNKELIVITDRIWPKQPELLRPLLSRQL